MEFKEFSNPEEQDYDVKMSVPTDIHAGSSINPYTEKLWDLIGILEDDEINEVSSKYGITKEEYFHPTAETIAKVKDYLDISSREGR